MSEKFVVTVRATSITVYPGEAAFIMLQPLIDMLTYEDEFMDETRTLGYMYDKESDTLFLHKGVDLNYLKRLLENVEFVNDLYHEYKQMDFEYEEIIAPRNDEQVDVINFISGMNHHSQNIEESQLFLVKQPGFGKAEPVSRKIPANNLKGYILMGDIKPGDHVFNRKGIPTCVTDVFPQGVKDVYKITFEDGRVAYCCKEHLWCVSNDNGVNWNCIKLEDMLDDFNYVIPMSHGTDHVPGGYRTSILALKYIHELIINNDDEALVLLKLLLVDTYVNRRILLHYISESIINSDHRVIHINEKYHYLVKQLIYSIGYTTKIENNDIYYYKSNTLRIINIEYSHQEECKCIMVSDPEHLYLTEDYIVTHNTYCSGVGLCKYNAKTLIIMHRDSLRKQWLNSLFNMSGLSSKYVHEIADSDELYAIAHNEHNFDYDVYLMTHSTFRAGLRKIQKLHDMMNITKNLGIGMKIIDEAHLEFRDTLLMDFVFNVKRNLYLTATDGRSSKDENSIFKHSFANALYYKPSVLLTSNIPKKWVDYISIAVNSKCNPNIYRYRVAGGRGMNNASYGKWVIAYDKKKTHFNCCLEILRDMIYNNDSHAKVLLFMPLIELCEECAYFLKMALGKDDNFEYDLDIRTINSKNSKQDNEYAKRADVIVTTIASCGTGTDIPGITDIISCSPYVSKITAEQVFGRIRYCGKLCHYYDIYDQSVQLDVFWYRSRSKKLKSLALNTKHLEWTNTNNTSDNKNK